MFKLCCLIQGRPKTISSFSVGVTLKHIHSSWFLICNLINSVSSVINLLVIICLSTLYSCISCFYFLSTTSNLLTDFFSIRFSWLSGLKRVIVLFSSINTVIFISSAIRISSWLSPSYLFSHITTSILTWSDLFLNSLF